MIKSLMTDTEKLTYLATRQKSFEAMLRRETGWDDLSVEIFGFYKEPSLLSLAQENGYHYESNEELNYTVVQSGDIQSGVTLYEKQQPLPESFHTM